MTSLAAAMSVTGAATTRITATTPVASALFAQATSVAWLCKEIYLKSSAFAEERVRRVAPFWGSEM